MNHYLRDALDPFRRRKQKKIMNENDMRIAIAEKCGWLWNDTTPKKADVPSWANEDSVYFSKLPDYTEDLNAMHEAECLITVNLIEEWGRILSEMIIPYATYGPNDMTWWMVRATARQRAEAFLRVFGLWRAAP